MALQNTQEKEVEIDSASVILAGGIMYVGLVQQIMKQNANGFMMGNSNVFLNYLLMRFAFGFYLLQISIDT